MAILIWRGDAQPIEQLVDVTPSNVETGDQFTVTINRKDATVTANEDEDEDIDADQTRLIHDVVSALAAAIGQYSHPTIPEFQEVSAAGVDDDGDGYYEKLRITGPADGKPFTATGTTTNNSGSLAVSVSTATDGDPGLNEKQYVRILGTATGGTFTLTFDGQTTGAIAYNASAATVETALEALSNIDDVTVTGSAGGPWTVEFKGVWANVNAPLMTADGSSITKGAGSYAVVVTTLVQGDPGDNAIQTVSLPNPSGGTFTLTFDGQTTGNVAYNASASTLQTALEALSNIAPGDVEVLGNAGGPWTVEFKATYANADVPLMTGSGANLTGVSTVVVSEQTKGSGGDNEVQYLQLIYDLVSDPNKTFTLSWDGSTTEPIRFGASASTIQSTMEKTPATGGLGMGAGNVSVALVSTTTLSGLRVLKQFTVTFRGGLGSLDVSQVTGSPSTISGVSPYVSTGTTTAGGANSTNETQRVRLSPNATGGTFTLTFRAQTTAAIAYNASAATLEAALELLSTVTDVTVTLVSSGVWDVEFVDPGDEDIPLMTGSGASLTGGNLSIVQTQDPTEPTDEVQEVTVLGNPKGGTFTLTHDGNTTAGIAYNATPADIEAALELLASITDVEVAQDEGLTGGPWLVTFRDPGGTNTAEMTADGSSLSGADLSIATIQTSTAPTNEVQVITLNGSPTGGTFTLTFESQTTSAIPYNATKSDVQSALEALSTIDVGEIVVSGNQGGPWTVTFLGTAGGTDQTAISGSAAGLTSTGDQALDVSTYRTASGPNWVSLADNWQTVGSSTAALPVNGDTIVFENSSVSALYGLDELSAVTVTNLHVRASYTGRIGLPAKNDNYYEYRPKAFAIGATNVFVGEGEGAGSAFVRLDLGSAQSAVYVYQTGTATEGQAFAFKGTHVSNTLDVIRGSVGVGTGEFEDVAKLATLSIGYRESVASDADVEVGPGVTQLTTIHQNGGTLRVEGDSTLTVTTATIRDGEAVLSGSVVVTTLSIPAGTVLYSSSGTVTTLELGNEGEVYFDRDLRARTVTNCTMNAGSRLIDRYRTVTFTNGVILNLCGLPEVTLDLGDDVKLTVTAAP